MAASTYVTKNGDVIDLIVYERYGGRQSGIVEAVFDANYGLADHLPHLPGGLIITLPDLPVTTLGPPLQKLWD